MSTPVTKSSGRSGPLRVGLIGAGSITRWHLPAFQRFPDELELVAVCDVVEDAARRVAGSDQRIQVFTDPQEMLASAELDAVDICTPHDLHAPLAIMAAERGKHVLVEKPMATRYEDCLAMVEAAEQSGVTLMVAQSLRYLPSYVALRKLLNSGELGEVWSARIDEWVTRAVVGITPTRPPTWAIDGKRAGGGVLPMQATHHIDLFRYFFGEVRSVRARVWNDNPVLSHGADDRAIATLEFENGLLVHLISSYTTRGPHTYQFVILGTKGTVYTEEPVTSNLMDLHHTPPLVWSSERSQSLQAPFEPVTSVNDELACEDAFVNELVHFARCCRTGATPISSGQDNLGTMRALFSIYESSHTGQEVDVASFTGLTA